VPVPRSKPNVRTLRDFGNLKKLDRAFYQRPAIELAPDLLGKILVRVASRVASAPGVGRRSGSLMTPVPGRSHARLAYRTRIVETEAYVGTHDLACHASKGRTRRTEVMFGPGGHAYVYLIYGMYPMFNIVASVEGDAQAVLIRAGEPLDHWKADLSGPGKLTRALRITCADNGMDLTGQEIFLLDDSNYKPVIDTTKRIGVDYAQEWRDELLRFVDLNSRAVSKMPNPKREIRNVSHERR
jgi:DNA-3-methyladenine glycosylase